MNYLELTGIFSLFQALLTGIALGLYYDLFRFVRRIRTFTTLAVAMQDLFFWTTSAIAVFFICITLNNGYIRIYFVFLAFLGWIVHYLTVGKMIFAVFDFLINILLKILNKCKSRLIKLLGNIYLKIIGG